MKNNRVKNFLNENLSVLKFSGINEYILLEIYESSYFLKVFKTSMLNLNIFSKRDSNNFKIIAEEFNSYDDLTAIKNSISRIKNEYNLSNPYLLVGINECRQSFVSISNDVEDTELWFLENSNSYLPEGLNNHDFASSFKKISEGDDSSCYQVISARKEYLKEIQKAFKDNSYTLISILTFSILASDNNLDEEALFLSANILPHKIYYSFKINNSHFIIDELYGEFINPNTKTLSDSEVISKISEIFNIVIGSSDERINKLRFQLTSPFELNKLISDNVLAIIKEEVNKEIDIIFNVGDNFTITLGNFISSFDESINLVEISDQEQEREKIEKTFTQRLIIACGTILIIPLFILYFFEGAIGSSIQAQEDSIIEVNSNRTIIDNLQKQKRNLIDNIATLIDLKKGNKSLSNIIEMASNICPDKNCFIEFKSTRKEQSQQLTFVGITSEQSNIPKIMSNLEESKKVSKVDLVYSNSIRKKDIPKSLSSNRTYYKYNIEAVYNDN